MKSRTALKALDKIPHPFKRIRSAQIDTAKHFLNLMEKPQYRREQGTVIVQGYKTIQELRKQNVKIKSLIATVKPELQDINDETRNPATDVLCNPKLLPAERYFVTDVNLTRRILGTSSKPSNHEIYAEVEVPHMAINSTKLAGLANAAVMNNQKLGQDKNSKSGSDKIGDETTTATTTGFISSETDKLLVLDGLKDPGNVGSLIRTAMGLGWKKGLVTSGTCDLYNNKAVRASRALSILWRFDIVPREHLVKSLLDRGYIPIAADMLPKTEREKDAALHSLEDILDMDQCKRLEDSVKSSNSNGRSANRVTLGGLLFHNFKSDIQGASLTQLLKNKKIALILSSEHHGVGQNSLLDDVIKVSVPMDPMVESLNVAAAGSIIMSQLSAYFPFLSLKKERI